MRIFDSRKWTSAGRNTRAPVKRTRNGARGQPVQREEKDAGSSCWPGVLRIPPRGINRPLRSLSQRFSSGSFVSSSQRALPVRTLLGGEPAPRARAIPSRVSFQDPPRTIAREALPATSQRIGRDGRAGVCDPEAGRKRGHAVLDVSVLCASGSSKINPGEEDTPSDGASRELGQDFLRRESLRGCFHPLLADAAERDSECWRRNSDSRDRLFSVLVPSVRRRLRLALIAIERKRSQPS